MSAAEMASTTKPHQVPSVSQPRRRQSRRMSAAQTKGTTMPMDFRSSVRQISASIRTELKMVKRPAAAARQAKAAIAGGLRVRESEDGTPAVTRHGRSQPSLQEPTLRPCEGRGWIGKFYFCFGA